MDTPTIGELLAAKCDLHGEKDDLNAKLSALNKRLDEVDRTLIDRLKAAGVNSAKGDGISVTLTEKMRTAYDPDKFGSIFKWAADNGYDYIIQRRFSDAKINDLIDRGVALPDGLRPEFYTDLSHRRS